MRKPKELVISIIKQASEAHEGGDIYRDVDRQASVIVSSNPPLTSLFLIVAGYLRRSMGSNSGSGCLADLWDASTGWPVVWSSQLFLGDFSLSSRLIPFAALSCFAAMQAGACRGSQPAQTCSPLGAFCWVQRSPTCLPRESAAGLWLMYLFGYPAETRR